MNPCNNNMAGLVDKRLGNSYEIVKAVYESLTQIAYVAANVQNLTPKDVELQESDDKMFLQWRYVGGTDWTNIISFADVVMAQEAATAAAIGQSQLNVWAYTTAFQLVSAERDSNGAIVTASIVWPDSATGAFTTDVASVDFPGAIDAWHATYVLGDVNKTVTQPAVTRDANGAVTAQPAITIV